MSTEIYLPQESRPIFSGHLFAEATETISITSPKSRARHNVLEIYHVSLWCTSIWKRVFDLACVLPALVLISPFLAIVAGVIRCTSHGPIIFRQQRAGRNRSLFTIYKFRTMVDKSESFGPEHTAKGDPRITSFGKFLRRFKLDELPQLYNVLRGDMSLVGPRPKLPHHEQTNMACRPGITGAATLAFRREQHILCEVPIEEMEEFYQRYVAPLKAELDAEFMCRETLISDVCILVATVLRIGRCLTSQDLFIASTASRKRRDLPHTIIFDTNGTSWM